MAHLPSATIQVAPVGAGGCAEEAEDKGGMGTGGEAGPMPKRPRCDSSGGRPASQAAAPAAVPRSRPSVDCDCFVANAAVEGDAFR